MKSAADDIVTAAKRLALATAPRPAAIDLDEEIATGRFPEQVERLRAPLQKIALYEGLLVQDLTTLALSHQPGFLVESDFRAEVTDADRHFLARNPHVDLDSVAPPAPGRRVATVDTDILVYDQQRRKLILLDVKRSPRSGESILPLREASLDARRRVQVQHPILATETWLLRWFGADEHAPKPYMLTRGTIDARLELEISPVVDYGLRSFRTAFAAHFQSLLGIPNPPRPEAGERRPASNDDLVAFRALFGRAARRGRLA